MKGPQPHAAPAEAAEVPVGGPETWIAGVLLAGMACLPVWDLLARRIGAPVVPGSSALVQHLTLWLTFAGAALAARAGRLLTLSTANFLPGWFAATGGRLAAAAGVAVAATLTVASVNLVLSDRGGSTGEMGIPVWVFDLALPAGYAAITAWGAWRAGKTTGERLAIIALALLLAGFGRLAGAEHPMLKTGGIAVVLVCAVAGLPIYAALSAVALMMFWYDGVPLASVPVSTYQLAANASLPAIPLFTLAGHVLSSGGSCKRLVRVFDALVGWMPGGLAIVTAVVFAFFTSFTGASGVTILSMGGLLLPVLLKSKYPETFSIGLVTATGSIGLLFPPSLPVILYGVQSFTQVGGKIYVAQIDHLFIAGFVPGLLLVALVGLWGIVSAKKARVVPRPFKVNEALGAIWETKWELAIPVLVFALYFGGVATLVEAGAITLLWSVMAECLIYRDLSITKDLPHVVADGSALVGGVLVVMGAALGFTNYLVDAHIPQRIAVWVAAHISSKLVFLLMLNVFMVIVGSVIEIYSAILVVVPLITPIAATYGVDPVHLGIIFLANLELGYLTPPVGLNLLLSSYRFNKTMVEVARATLPFLIIMTIGVLLITYVPALSIGVLHWVQLHLLQPATVSAAMTP